jgi:hypothetical protein
MTYINQNAIDSWKTTAAETLESGGHTFIGTFETRSTVIFRLVQQLRALPGNPINQGTIDGSRTARASIILRLIDALRVSNGAGVRPPSQIPTIEQQQFQALGTPYLTSHSSVRSRLTIGGTFFRSLEYGLSANQIMIGVVEDFTGAPQGQLVLQHCVLKPSEMISSQNMTTPDVLLTDLTLLPDQEIRVELVGGLVRARLYGIRWQIGGGSTLLADFGEVKQNRLLSLTSTVTFMITSSISSWPSNGVLYLRPRVHRFPLVYTSYTDPDTLIVTNGWDIGSLRVSLGGTNWASMPARGSDAMDHEGDAIFLTAFDMTAMQAGDGFPATPAGLYTGPKRTLAHVNYIDTPATGIMVPMNIVYEWIGSGTVGAWQQYVANP